MPTANINHVEIHYEVYGHGTPILMIHGFTPDLRLMKGAMEPVFKEREGYKRIYLDLPGMGHTKNYEKVHNTDDMLETVLAFVDTLLPDQPFLVAGQSYGGYLARGIIAKRPEQVQGAAFICPLIIPEMEKRNLPEHAILYKDEALLETLSEEDRTDFQEMNTVLNEKTWERYQKEVRCGCSIADHEFLAQIKKQYGYTFAIDQVPYESPTVFILGKQDVAVGYKDALQLMDLYTRSTFAVLDKAGHNLHIEQQDTFNSLILEWLDRVEEHQEK